MSALFAMFEDFAVEDAGGVTAWANLTEDAKEDVRAKVVTWLVSHDMASRGGQLGGLAAAKRMTKEQRVARARKAAVARWHRG